MQPRPTRQTFTRAQVAALQLCWKREPGWQRYQRLKQISLLRRQHLANSSVCCAWFWSFIARSLAASHSALRPSWTSGRTIILSWPPRKLLALSAGLIDIHTSAGISVTPRLFLTSASISRRPVSFMLGPVPGSARFPLSPSLCLCAPTLRRNTPTWDTQMTRALPALAATNNTEPPLGTAAGLSLRTLPDALPAAPQAETHIARRARRHLTS